MKHTIDLLDRLTVLQLNDGLYCKLRELRTEECNTELDKARNKMRQSETYLTLAKLSIHFDQATLKSYEHTPLETKLVRAKVASGKVQVEIAAADLEQWKVAVNYLV